MRTYAKVVATTNITKSGTQTIDGVALAANDRVLLTGQTAVSPAGSDNGLWDVKSSAWTRSTDADTELELRGLSVFVTQGASRGNTAWQCTSDIPITIGTSAIQFSRIPGASEQTWLSSTQPCVDQLCQNLLDTPVALTNDNITKTVADGRRYQLPSGVLTQPRTLTLLNVGAVEGDTITIFSEQKGHHALVVKNAGGTPIMSVLAPGMYCVEYDGTAWKTRTPSGMQMFSVKDYGAVGDERITLYDPLHTPTQEAAAIQACIDAAAACCRDGNRSGAVVYFPPGTYRTDGVPLIHRRTPYLNPLMFLGAGGKASMLMNAIGIGPNGDLFRAETLAENPNAQGGEQHTFQDLALVAKHYCYVWDFGDALQPGTHDAIRLAPRFIRMFFSRTGTPGPAVRIRIPSRARFFECVFDPATFAPGVFGAEIVRGSGSMIWCRGGGGLVRFRDASEVSLLCCRAEGAQGIPSWDFYNVTHLVIQNATNEGNDEVDACFRFVECKDVSCDAISPSIARPTGAQLTASKSLTGSPTLIFSHVDETSPFGSPLRYVAENKIVRSAGSWFEDGIGYGGRFQCTNALTNTARYTILEATHDTLWVAETVAAETVATATGNATSPLGLLSPASLPAITFTASDQKIARASGSWIVDGFTIGMSIRTIALGLPAPTNPGPFIVTNVTATQLTVASGIVNEGPVTKLVLGDKWVAGSTFRSCWGFNVRNQYQFPRFADLGDQTRYGIEVDGNCRDGWVENSHNGASTDISISPTAYNVVGQSHSHSTATSVRKTFWHGRHRVVGLDIEEDLVHLRKEKTTPPVGLAGLSVRRDNNGFHGIWYSDASSGWYAAVSLDESSIFSLDDFHANRFIGPRGDAAYLVARAGQAVVFKTSVTNTNVGDYTLGSWQKEGASGSLMTANNLRVYGPGYINLESGAGCTMWATSGDCTIAANTGLVHISAGGTRFKANSAGIGFFSAGPTAQAADTGALTDSSGGAVDGTIVAVSGSGADVAINNNFADLAAKYNALRTLLRSYGLMA